MNNCFSIITLVIFEKYSFSLKQLISSSFPGVQGWRSGESTCHPPMWPHMTLSLGIEPWVEFVGSLLCTERFSPGTPLSPLLKNQHLI